jgi:hypothetical protein
LWVDKRAATVVGVLGRPEIAVDEGCLKGEHVVSILCSANHRHVLLGFLECLDQALILLRALAQSLLVLVGRGGLNLQIKQVFSFAKFADPFTVPLYKDTFLTP